MGFIDWNTGMERPQKGKWFPAEFSGGEKSCCGDRIEVGEDIRADGHGGWEGRCCDDIPQAPPSKRKSNVCPRCFLVKPCDC